MCGGGGIRTHETLASHCFPGSCHRPLGDTSLSDTTSVIVSSLWYISPMHIMLFGGAFDPPHNGHLDISHAIVEQKIADEIWFIPCATHPFGKKMSPVADRLALLRLADHVTINTHEIDSVQTSYTFDTIEHFATTQPQHRFSWLIGSDQLPSFTRWHRWEDLIENYSVYVYPRQDFPFDQLQAGMITLKQLPRITISSTMIRALVQKNAPIDHLVSPAVASYIQEHHLYATPTT